MPLEDLGLFLPLVFPSRSLCVKYNEHHCVSFIQGYICRFLSLVVLGINKHKALLNNADFVLLLTAEAFFSTSYLKSEFQNVYIIKETSVSVSALKLRNCTHISVPDTAKLSM